jgi:hypothetical protein
MKKWAAEKGPVWLRLSIGRKNCQEQECLPNVDWNEFRLDSAAVQAVAVFLVGEE